MTREAHARPQPGTAAWNCQSNVLRQLTCSTKASPIHHARPALAANRLLTDKTVAERGKIRARTECDTPTNQPTPTHAICAAASPVNSASSPVLRRRGAPLPSLPIAIRPTRAGTEHRGCWQADVLQSMFRMSTLQATLQATVCYGCSGKPCCCELQLVWP